MFERAYIIKSNNAGLSMAVDLKVPYLIRGRLSVKDSFLSVAGSCLFYCLFILVLLIHFDKAKIIGMCIRPGGCFCQSQREKSANGFSVLSEGVVSSHLNKKKHFFERNGISFK